LLNYSCIEGNPNIVIISNNLFSCKKINTKVTNTSISIIIIQVDNNDCKNEGNKITEIIGGVTGIITVISVITVVTYQTYKHKQGCFVSKNNIEKPQDNLENPQNNDNVINVQKIKIDKKDTISPIND
jgi:hypothetical protein